MQTQALLPDVLRPPDGPHAFRNIDLIRFVSAVIVFSAHIPHFIALADRDAWLGADRRSAVLSAANLLFCGPAAVMMFFIVSGVCIHAPYRHGKPVNLAAFYAQRYVRIGVPLLGASALLALVTGSDDLAVLGVWSLVCEAAYYLLYPFLLLAAGYAGFLPVFLASVLAAVVLCATPDAGGGNVLAYGPRLTWILFLPVWMTGVWISETAHAARPWPAWLKAKPALAMMTLGLAVLSVLATVLQFHGAGVFKYKASMLAFSVPACLLVHVLLSVDLSASRLLRFLDRQGVWSYSLYLVHTLAILVFARLLLWGGIRHLGQAGALAAFAAVTGFGLLCGWCFYRLVERPSHLSAKWVGARLRRAPALTVRPQPLRLVGGLSRAALPQPERPVR